MGIAYSNRCPASSWRGAGEAPGRNRCIYVATLPHEVHRDECGNNFMIQDGTPVVVTIGKCFKPA